LIRKKKWLPKLISDSSQKFILAPSIKTCEYWFRLFKSGNFDSKERLGQPKKFEDAELQALLDENLARMLEELAQTLNIDKSTVSDRLQAMRKIQKEGKYVSHKLFELVMQNRLTICTSLLSLITKRNSFCIKL